ncbi:hypothetical protein Ae201684_004755 [Aphanomyces euteiches]|uniref:Uncharacterized protein n=1 Tax=Aphanomyces euteiches TaxID=100861 RepID=A0A6G0XGY2_9STRA|nr:hypothetical protein Ae201684_004755 [Aphanomyces euteiches]
MTSLWQNSLEVMTLVTIKAISHSQCLEQLSETKLWQGYPKTCSLQKAWTHSAFCALEILAPSSMLPHFTMLTMWLYDVGFRKLIDLEALNCQL